MAAQIPRYKPLGTTSYYETVSTQLLVEHGNRDKWGEFQYGLHALTNQNRTVFPIIPHTSDIFQRRVIQLTQFPTDKLIICVKLEVLVVFPCTNAFLGDLYLLFKMTFPKIIFFF